MGMLGFAGILRKDLTEVLVDVERGTSTDKNALRKDRAVLLVLVEVVRVPRNVVTELPDAMTTYSAGAIEGVESSGGSRVEFHPHLSSRRSPGSAYSRYR